MFPAETRADTVKHELNQYKHSERCDQIYAFGNPSQLKLEHDPTQLHARHSLVADKK